MAHDDPRARCRGTSPISTQLAGQFDLVFHFDETRAVQPLDRAGAWAVEEVPETYASGL